MILYNTEWEINQSLTPCSIHEAYRTDQGLHVVLRQEDSIWCPYRRIISPYRTIRLYMQTSEVALRSNMLRNTYYIRAILAHDLLLKAGEDDYDLYQRQLELQLVTEHEEPYIDEFGLYVYQRLEVSMQPSDVDLRYTNDIELENLYNYGIRKSRPVHTSAGLPALVV